MKTLAKQSIQHWRYKTVFIVFFCLCTSIIQGKEVERKHSDSRRITPEDVIYISTTHAKDVTIKTTDELTASFNVTITIKMDDSEENDNAAKILFDDFKYKIGEASDGIAMKFDQGLKKHVIRPWETTIKTQSGKEITFSGRMFLDISIEMNIPKQNNVKVKSTFSTILMGHLTGSCYLNLSHSKLTANDFKELDVKALFSNANVGNIQKKSSISLSQSQLNGLTFEGIDASLTFSTIDIANCKNALITDLSHSTFKAQNAGDVTINSSNFAKIDIKSANNVNIKRDGQGKISIDEFSKLNIIKASFSKIDTDGGGDIQIANILQANVNIKTANNILIESSEFTDFDFERANTIKLLNDSHGKVNVQDVKSFMLNDGKFTKINIYSLSEAISVDTEHSNMLVSNLKSGVKKATIKNSFASVTLGVEQVKDIDMYIHNGRFTDINYNGDMQKKSDGYYIKRTNNTTPTEINITCPDCNININ